MVHRLLHGRSPQLLTAAVAFMASTANLCAQEVAQTLAPVGPVWNAKADSPFEAFLVELDSPNYAVRQSATEKLAAIREGLRLSLMPAMRNMFDAFVLESANRADLSPEQRARLAGPMRDKFFSRPRAAMGINIQPPQSLGIPILPQRGFPCAGEGLLKPGDYLAQIDGVSLENNLPDVRQRNDITLRLQFAILSHEPGEVVPVLVRRPVQRADGRAGGEFQTIRMSIPLGAWSQLVQLGQPGTRPLGRTMLHGAWEHHKRKLGVTTPADDPGMLFPSTTSSVKWEANRMNPGVPVPPSITIGSPHAGADEAFFNNLRVANSLRQGGQAKLLIGPNGRVRPGAQLRINQTRAIPTPGQLLVQQMAQSMARLRTQNLNLQAVETLIDIAKDRLLKPDLLPQDRRSIESKLAALMLQAKTNQQLIDGENVILRKLQGQRAPKK